jgi:hypothetical protein
VAMKLGALRFTSELAELLTENLLLVNIDILVAEEHDATLRDYITRQLHIS